MSTDMARRLHAAAQRRHRQTAKGKASQARAQRLYRQRHRDRKQAWSAVQHAIEGGRMAPEPCRDCGSENAQAHHHLGYAVEHRLDVVWLCDTHHKAAHAARRY